MFLTKREEKRIRRKNVQKKNTTLIQKKKKKHVQKQKKKNITTLKAIGSMPSRRLRTNM